MQKHGKLASHPGRVAWAALALALASGCHSDSKSSARESNDLGGSGGSGGSAAAGAAGSGGSGGDRTDSGGASSSAGAAGAGACETPAIEAAIDVVGVYLDEYDFSHRVTDEAWLFGDSRFEVVDFSNDERWIVAQNDDDNDFNPGLYSRFEWNFVQGELFYCQSVYDAPSEASARSADRADAGDLSGGCGGFSWSRLTGIEIAGVYEDDFGGRHEITTSSWRLGGYADFHLLSFSNRENWAIYQNDCGNAYNPGLYSRFDWTTNDLGAAGAAGAGSALHFCQTGYDAESEAAAIELSPADAGDLETGCNGFSWSELTPSD